MRPIVLLLALGLAGCSFKSQSKLRVQVYGGPLESTAEALDPREVVAASSRVRSECEKMVELAQRADDTASEATDHLVRTLEAIDDVVVAHVKADSASLAADYAAAWKSVGVGLLSISKEDLAKDDKWNAGVSVARTALGTAKFTRHGTDLRDYLRRPYERSLALNEDGLDFFREVAGVLVDADSDARALRRRFEADADGERRKALATAIRDGAPFKADAIEVPGFGEAWVRAITESRSRISGSRTALTAPDGEVQRCLAAARAAARELSGVATNLKQLPENMQAADGLATGVLKCAADLQDAVQKLGDAVSAHLSNHDMLALRDSWESALSMLLSDDRSSVAAREAAPEAVKALPGMEGARTSQDVVRLCRASLSRAHEELARALQSPAQARASAASLVELTRSRPFLSADPNLRTITAADNEALWRELPIDSLETCGEGLTQFIVVQDGPTSYRLKELHVDPSGVIDLRLSISDVALDVLRAVAETRLGVKLPSDGGDGQASSTELHDSVGVQSEQIEFLDESLRSTLRSLSQYLRAQVQSNIGNGNELDDAELAEVRGRLKGDLQLLTALKAEAGALLAKPKSGGEDDKTP